MFHRPLFTLLLACCLLPTGIAQETGTEQTNPIYESVVFPDRALSRKLDQADRLFESGRTSETAQLLGTILEHADFAFLMPEQTDERLGTTTQPIRTLRHTVFEHIIGRIRSLPKEARDSYAFQFEPTAKRLLENAVSAGSLDEIQLVARQYFPTASGASAAFLAGLIQFERGDYAAAFITLNRLKRWHPSLPDSLEPALEQMLAELLNMQNTADPVPQRISEAAWLEQTGWRLPMGSPSHNPDTKATTPLLEQNWTIPLLIRSHLERRETDSVARMLKSSGDVYIPAAQPLLIGDLFVTRTRGETIAIDTNTGKRLWVAAESEYRLPEGTSVFGSASNTSLRSALWSFFWHNRIALQLSSDGEKVFGVDGHDVLNDSWAMRRMGGVFPNIAGKAADLRFGPGNTLTARDMKTGQTLWQVGKFPYVQKYFDTLFAQIPPQPDNIQILGGIQIQGGIQVRGGMVLNRGMERENIDDAVFTDDENLFKETWFLGAPLPLHGRLYVIGETDGILQLFMLESQTGSLIAKQTLAGALSPIATSTVRRTYPLFPSESEGILVCPTGTDLVVALDAATLSPIWCYSYAAVPADASVDRMMPFQPGLRQRQMVIQQQAALGTNLSTQGIRDFFERSGWQVPCIIVDRHRVLAAPPDRAALYCLDLLTGELLWQRTFSRLNALYAACVQNDKVFLVTPTHLMAIDMKTGREVTFDGHKFPQTVKPAGVGVHSGNHYFIPFSDGYLAVADLNEGKLAWLDASGSAVQPPASREAADLIDSPDSPVQQNNNDWSIFPPVLKEEDVFQKPVPLGNLVGLKGRFFSQSPTYIACFDQKEPLKQRTEMLLQSDPNDPEGLLQQGRILKSEGRLTEAVDYFRSSLKAKPTAAAADLLRKNLLEAMRKDYASWADACRELESLAEFPEELGTILYAQAEGIVQSGQTDDLAAVLEKVFILGHQQSFLIPVSGDHSAQLHRALGCLIEQNMAKGSPALKAAWEQLAETFLQRLTEDTGWLTLRTEYGGLMPYTGYGMLMPPAHSPPEIQRWSMFADVFRSTSAAAQAKQILREKYERYHLPIALNLQQEPSAIPVWTELSAPLVWKSGIVRVFDGSESPVHNLPSLPQTQGDANKAEIDRLVNRLVTHAKSADSQLDSNQLPVPFLGPPDSEHAAFHFAVKTWAAESFLSCSDLSGREQWRLALPVSAAANSNPPQERYGGGYFTYIKGIRNFLLFVRGNSMIAIDATPQSEKILWSKTLSSPLAAYQSSGDRRLGYSQPQQRLNAAASFPKNSLFISPQAVCCWDTNCVYGLDPLTGQTLWVRKVPSENCTILGDEENLFLVFPDIRYAAAVDPASGRELEDGTIPSGGTHIFRTNIVFTGNDFSLGICDLRSMYDKRRRALLVSDSPDGKLTANIPAEMLNGKLNSAPMVQMLREDRFLSLAVWATKTLQIYDLQTKKKLLPDDNTLLDFVPAANMGAMRYDVELVGDHFLVLFIKETNIRAVAEPAPRGGELFQRTHQILNAVPCIGVGEGYMMLFDSEGNPCWQKPAEIKNRCRLLDVPDGLPVMLFAVAYTERDAEQRLSYGTALVGIDKRSGEVRFSKGIRASTSATMQRFQITADIQAQEIVFTPIHVPPPQNVITLLAPRAVRFVFTEEE